MAHRLSLSSLVGTLGAAALLSACSGGATSPPPFPPAAPSAQSAAHATDAASRATLKHKTKAPALSADPASLHFTADQAAAAPPVSQFVTVTARSGGELSASIAGTGNCPSVSPATLKPKRADEDGDRDRDRNDPRRGVLTVTPNGAGPATCTITVTRHDRDGGDEDRDEHRDEHNDGKGDHHDGDHHDNGANDVLLIPVIVDAPPAPTPPPTPVPTPTPVVR